MFSTFQRWALDFFLQIIYPSLKPRTHLFQSQQYYSSRFQAVVQLVNTSSTYEPYPRGNSCLLLSKVRAEALHSSSKHHEQMCPLWNMNHFRELLEIWNNSVSIDKSKYIPRSASVLYRTPALPITKFSNKMISVDIQNLSWGTKQFSARQICFPFLFLKLMFGLIKMYSISIGA